MRTKTVTACAAINLYADNCCNMKYLYDVLKAIPCACLVAAAVAVLSQAHLVGDLGDPHVQRLRESHVLVLLGALCYHFSFHGPDIDSINRMNARW